MIIIFFVLFLLLIGFVNFLVNKFKKDKKYNRKFYDFGDGNILVYSIILIILVYTCINFFVNNPTFSSAKGEIEYGRKTVQPWLVSDAYAQLAQSDSLNLDNHFNLVKMHFDEHQYLCPDVKHYNREGTFIYYYFTGLSQRDDKQKADIGNLFLGIYYYMKNDYDNALHCFDEVKNRKLKYLNNYLGRIDYYYNKTDSGKTELKKEIALNGDLAGAYEHLARIYDFEQRYDELKPLVYDAKSNPYVPFELRQEIYVKNGDVGLYFKNLFSEVFKNTNLVGLSGALLIMITWFIYLMRVNIHRKSSWLTCLFVVLFSAILVPPVWLLYDFYRYALHFDLSGKIFHDFLYCVFGIGVIEELVKILPFLILLRFTNLVKQPIDYIMYASLSALGFAFVENFHYFQQGSLNIMHSRALTASIAHMIFSSVIAYGLIIAKFKRKKNALLYFFLFFLIAAFAHGFYDFWLLNDQVSDYFIVTFMCLLTCVLVYASFINNALNNPVGGEQNIQLNTSRLASDLAGSLIGIFIFEFICLSFIYGPTIGNRELLSSTLGGGYMILFLSVRLSNIDVFPGDWGRIDFFAGLTPVQILYGDKKPNYNAALGTKIRIRNFRKKGKLENILPLEGEIVKREKISNHTGWFLVKLNAQLPYVKLDKEHILIRAKNPVELIGREEEVFIYFTTIPNMATLDQSLKKQEQFHFIDWAIAGKPKPQA